MLFSDRGLEFPHTKHFIPGSSLPVRPQHFYPRGGCAQWLTEGNPHRARAGGIGAISLQKRNLMYVISSI